MQGPEHLIEFAHGYTYSGHPVACAAALGAIETYRDEDLFAGAQGRAVDGDQNKESELAATGKTRSIRSRGCLMSSTCAISA